MVAINYLKKELYKRVKNDDMVFDFIQSGSLDGIWYWDLENQNQEWMSPKFWKTLGYSPQTKKHLTSEWQDIIYKEDLEEAIIRIQKHIENPEKIYDQIVRYHHKDGSTVWIRCRGLVIRDQQGKPIRMLGAHTDITPLMKKEMEVERLSKEYERVFNGTQDAMFLVQVCANDSFKYIRNNQAHQMKTGVSLEMIKNKKPEDLLGKELGAFVSANYQRCVDKGESITYEEVLELPAGKRVWRTTLTPIYEGDTIDYIVGSAQDITIQRQLEKELTHNANYDELTKIPNRRLFFEQLNQIISESERDHQKFSLLFIDLDGFKGINDTYGHDIGDAVLIEVANRLNQTLRKSDVVARMGGDEYTIILRNIKDEEGVITVVKKIQASIKEKMFFDDFSCQVDSSIGISIYPKDGKVDEELINKADKAMYTIKKNGKSGYKFYQHLR